MDNRCIVENGVQLLARSIRAPVLRSLHDHLFAVTPKPGHIIELVNDQNVPYAHLLYEIISNVILPVECGGNGAEVTYLLTDGHFDAPTFITTLKSIITKTSDKSNLRQILAESLKRLRLVRAFDSEQMFITILSLERLLVESMNTCLIVADTLTAFYWADRLRNSVNVKMDQYAKTILKHLQAATKDYKTLILYTRPSYFFTKSNTVDESLERCVEECTAERINHRIVLSAAAAENPNNNVYNIEIIDGRGKKIKKIVFDNDEISWL